MSAVEHRIVVAADELEAYLDRNLGENADWPLALTVSGKEDAEKTVSLLSELNSALKPYRDAKTQLDNRSLPPQSPNA